MTTYLFECEKCGKTVDVEYVMGAAPRGKVQLGHYTKKGHKCHGDLKRKFTPPNIRIN